MTIEELQADNDRLRAAILKFINADGHDLCIENRRELAAAAGIELPCPWPNLPPEAEFERGCQEYRQKIYHS